MHLPILILALSLSRASSTRALTTPSHTVDTGYATYLGNFTAPYSVAYLGVPYAEPPTGNQRFRAPVPLNTKKLSQNKALHDAQSYPNFCVQGTTGGGDAGGAGSEDCLKVNIYTPVNSTATSKLPVLFYIHGGGYIYGNPRNWPFEHWINQSPNVVIVSVYYRLDSFGFLAHPSFSDPANGDLNAGFLDQIEALKWVKRNIGAFGGDPSRVTINGQSAGGGSVQLHLVANEGEKLFSGAIAQSVYRAPMPTPDQLLPLFNFYAGQAGCALGTTAAVLACLRKASISALARAQDAAGKKFNASLYKQWIPSLDGKVITDEPTTLLAQGRFAHVPVISGATTNETQGGSDLNTALHNNFPQLTTQDLSEFDSVYNPADFTSEQQRIRTATGETGLRCGRETIGAAGVKYSKAWIYRYNQPNPTNSQPGDTEHAAENWMMFLGSNTGTNGTTTFTGLNNVETAFSEELIAYWLSFVRAEDPNRFKLSRSPTWADFSTGNRVVLQEDPKNSTVVSGMFTEKEPVLEAERCVFIASKANHMQD